MKSVLDPSKLSIVLDRGYQLGIDPAGVAQQLREIASEIDAGNVYLLKAVIYHRLSPEDFQTAGIVLQLSERLTEKVPA
jgi:hypothetical protein